MFENLSGRTFHNWKVIAFSHIQGRTGYYWHVKCTNCGIGKKCKSGHFKARGGCRNCELMPKGQTGFNRLYYQYNKGANLRCIEFDINQDVFRRITSSPCFYCGVAPNKIKTSDGGNKSTWGNYVYNGIDRKNNKIGYTDENCIPCCTICNRAKNSMSFEAFKDYIVQFANSVKEGKLNHILVS